MKITFLLTGLGLSGGARVVFEYANRLKDRGHEVNIVYPVLPLLMENNLNVRSIRQDIGASIRYRQTKRLNWFDLRASLIRVPSLRPQHIKMIEQLIPDADVLIATARETALPACLMSPRKGDKFYFIQHYEIWGLWDDEGCWQQAEKLAGSRNGLSLAMYHVVPADESLRRQKELADATYRMPLKKITISSWLKALLEEKFGQKVERTITNAVNFDTFYPENCKAGETVRVLMPFRPYRNKGTDDGLAALEVVRERHPETQFVMYGDTGGKVLPEWIEFHAKVSDDELRILYSSADIFVSPSWTEGSGLPPLEAMACHCAVVSTNIGGVPDYAVDGETILTCPPRDPDSLASCILRLIENPAERQRIADNGYRHVQQFTWEKAVLEFEAAITPGVTLKPVSIPVASQRSDN